MEHFKEPIEFEWDEGNRNKNLVKHSISNEEAEEPFFDTNKITFKDVLHSDKEERFRILGKTRKERLLFIVFTKRRDKVRIISARDVNKKEVYLYEKKVSTTKV